MHGHSRASSSRCHKRVQYALQGQRDEARESGGLGAPCGHRAGQRRHARRLSLLETALELVVRLHVRVCVVLLDQREATGHGPISSMR